jgi:hypothetical protein
MTSTPPAAPAAPAAKSPVLSIISLITGIVGLLGACCFGAGFLPAVAGIVLGVLGRQKEPKGKGMAMTGIITGALGALLSVIIWILLAVAPTMLSFLPGTTVSTFGY